MASSVIKKTIVSGDVVNNLTSMATDKPLSAAQGKALNDNITKLNRTTVSVNQSATGNRGTVIGKYMYSQEEVTVNLKFTASTTLSSSPRVIEMSSYKPAEDCALSCIDITRGISSAIGGLIACGIGTNGSIYVKECTTNHVYAITGTYIRA